MDSVLNILTCKTWTLNLSTGASVPVSGNKSNNGWNRIGKEWLMSRKCLAHCAACNEGLNCKLSKWTITLTAQLHWKCLCIYWISPHKKLRRKLLLLYSAAEGTKQWYAWWLFQVICTFTKMLWTQQPCLITTESKICRFWREPSYCLFVFLCTRLENREPEVSEYSSFGCSISRTCWPLP